MNSLRNFLGRVFDIRVGEWDRLLLLYMFAFMLNVSIVWGKASSESLFLNEVGIEVLPLMFVADAILNVIAILVYTAFADRIPNKQVMIAILVVGAASLFGARFGIFVDYQPTYLILYLISRVLQVIVSLHSWTYIADFYDTRTAKRHYPLIASGSRTSGILAGLLIVPLVTLFNTPNLVVAWGIALLIAAVISWYTPRKAPPVTVPEDNVGRQDQGVISNIREGFGFVTGTSFLVLMGAAALLSTLLLYLLDFQSQAFFVERFTTADELTAFYGLLGAIANAIALPIQMFLLSRVVTKLGVGNANLIFPGIASISYALLLTPTLFSASLAHVNHTALRSAFRTPIDSLLYNAVPINVKGRARAFNSLLIPVGTLFAGLILIALPIGTTLKVIGITVALLYIVVAYRLRRAYARSLTSLLAEDELNIFRLGDMESDQPKDVTIRLIKERISQTEDEALLVFLSEMLYDLQGRTATPTLIDLTKAHGYVVRSGVMDLIGSRWHEDETIRELLINGLDDEAIEVKRSALQALIGHEHQFTHDEELLDIFLKLLTESDEEVQAMVVPPLIASGDFYYLAPGVEMLSRWLSTDASGPERTLGLRVLARTGSDRMVRTMIRYLEDPEPMVRRQATALIDSLTANTFDKQIRELGLRTLTGLLDDEDETVRLTAVQSLGNFDSPEASMALIHALADRSFTVRRLASKIISDRVGEELEASLDLENQYMAESAAFILSSSNHTRARRRALELMDKLVGDTYALIAQRMPLEAIDTPAVSLLRNTLEEQESQLMDRFFWLLGALSSEVDARNVRLALQESEKIKRANAIEALESLTSPGIAQRVSPLYSAGTDLSTQVEEWKTSLNLAVITKWQVFFQFWPRLRDASRTTLRSRSLFLPDDDGWLQATAMMAIVEMEKQGLLDEPNSPVDKSTVRLALEASTKDEMPVVYETAEIALKRLLSQTENPREGTMLTLIEKVIFLKEVPFFADMEIAQLRVLANISEEKEFKEGETVFEEGDYGDALYVVIEGEIALQKRQVSASGRQTNIRRLTTHTNGEYFAEMNIFDDKPHQYDAVAIKDTQLLLIRRDTLVALINYQPDLSVTLLKVLSERLRQYSDVIAEKSEAKPEQLVNLFDRLS
ncbi:MAG: cyclic nucleotide-binding domain-containing protein [Chloroflexi bacterium]|nr:cyclic nucleotide-binding domain-containing protein [Chloroflexota bacterium]